MASLIKIISREFTSWPVGLINRLDILHNFLGWNSSEASKHVGVESYPMYLHRCICTLAYYLVFCRVPDEYKLTRVEELG
jgi:hypothetical protein